MRTYQNHLVDPTFFYDAIEEFAFDYDLYVIRCVEIDEDGMTINKWDHQIIRGSFQRDTVRRIRSKSGSTDDATANFYCKSLYRININDILEYHNNFYIVESVDDYDEYGVRNCSLRMIQLTKYRDLSDYIKYLRGEKLVWKKQNLFVILQFYFVNT